MGAVDENLNIVGKRVLLLMLVWLVAAVGEAAGPAKIPVWVGPETRDGFVDVDSRIVASIKDIRTELKKDDCCTIVESAEDATVKLIVVARHTSKGQGGSVGVPIGASTFFLPFDRNGIEFVLR